MLRKKLFKFFITLLAVIFICFTGVGLILFLLILSKRKMQPTTSSATMIILGAQIKGELGKTYPTQTLKERLDTGADYLKKYPQTTVIVSGGQGADEAESEAAVMATYLARQGIVKNRLILEDKSTSTKENLIFSNQLRSLDNAILVTSDYHMYRSLLLAKKQQLNVQGLSAPTKNPSKYYSYLRETLALALALLKMYL